VCSVKTSSTLDPADFLRRVEQAAQPQGFRAHPFGLVTADGTAAGSGTFPLLAFTRRARRKAPRVYISAGIHGDEPAGPEALLRLLDGAVFDDRAHWFLVPLLNPIGTLLRTRENAAALDLNRDYRTPQSPEIQAHVRWLAHQPRFNLALCLHEDWEATGFYLYELNPEERPSLAPTMLEAAQAHLPIDPATVIDGRPVTVPGIIRPDHDPRLRDLWAEAIYLNAHHCSLVYTLETPSSTLLTSRVTTLAAATRSALTEFFTGDQ
jgi:murein peptide amidase A